MVIEKRTVLAKNLDEWQFVNNPNYVLLPIDYDDQTSLSIRNVIFSKTPLQPFKHNVQLVCSSNDSLIRILDMDHEIINTKYFINFIDGSRLPHGACPVSHRYGGHQYGTWMGQLGDGRVHLIGEFVNRLGQRWQLQLKGSGQTPYSRTFDGRYVLRSSIREMVGSEACHFLGIPTIRSAALVVSEDLVVRDVHYNGKYIKEKAASLLRLSTCWFRFGSLEILTHSGEIHLLKQLCDYIIQEYYTKIELDDDNKYIRLFSEIAHRTLDLVAKWQALGFAHGLLNTDNMNIMGITMDYGPFGFVDSYDSGYLPNSSDREGRYSLGKQPEIVLWNLNQLANAFRPLLTASQLVHLTHLLKSLETYAKKIILEKFLLKIGLKEDRWGDENLIDKLLEMMQQTGADFTATFRQMAEVEPKDMASFVYLEQKWSLKRLSTHFFWRCWLDQYQERLDKEADHASNMRLFEDERRFRMLSANPVYVPRNWILHEAIVDAENNDFRKVQLLLEIFRNPYVIHEEAENRGYSSQPPQWAYELKISCSS